MSTAWDTLAGLPLTVADVAYEQRGDDARRTMLVRLAGGGAEGHGEDVSPFGDDFGPYSPPPPLPLAGDWALGAFCAAVGGLRLWETDPEWEPMHRYRRWAIESAALDLALRQAGLSLPEALGRPARPLRFVHSLGLGEPPAFDVLAPRLERYPDLRFKLDVTEDWTPELLDAVAATGAADVLDFKGRYGMEVRDEARLLAVYDAALERFDDALIEDPHDLPAVAERLAPHAARLSFDAPVHTVADVVALGSPTVNVKPCRVGDLAELFAVYDHCDGHGIRMYGGGMGEIGVGRGQAQLLAALAHPDAPNDIAPSAYNAPDGLAPGLPVSPLVPDPPAGFRWA